MNKAAKALDDKKGMDAVKNQDQSIKDLQAAKKALEDQAKEIQKRRDALLKDLEAVDKELANVNRAGQGADRPGAKE